MEKETIPCQYFSIFFLTFCEFSAYACINDLAIILMYIYEYIKNIHKK